MRAHASIIIGLFAVSFHAASPLIADILPAPTYSVFVIDPDHAPGYQSLNTPGQLSSNFNSNGGSTSSTASLVAGPNPALSATVINTQGAFTDPAGLADASLTYAFEVVGPSNYAVPIDIFAAGSATQVGNGDVSARIQSPFFSAEACMSCVQQSFSFTSADSAVSNAVYSVTLSVTATNFGNENFQGRAQVDPYIYIDPGFANASEYSIIVSDGIGNSPPGSGGGTGGGGTSPVPESNTLILLGTGILVIAGQARHKFLERHC